MTVKVIRIIGESYDFETNEEIPKSVVLSNGIHELTVPVSDQAAKAVVQMMVEAAEAAVQQERPRFTPPDPEEHPELFKRAPDNGGQQPTVEEAVEAVRRSLMGKMNTTLPDEGVEMTVEEPEAVEVVTDTFGPEVAPAPEGPGADYDDELTGTESI